MIVLSNRVAVQELHTPEYGTRIEKLPTAPAPAPSLVASAAAMVRGNPWAVAGGWLAVLTCAAAAAWGAARAERRRAQRRLLLRLQKSDSSEV